MENDIISIQQRLNNILSIKPLLHALHTISLSNWKLALRRSEQLKTYLDELNLIKQKMMLLGEVVNPKNHNDIKVVIFGSTRGLCGRFNRDLFYYMRSQLIPYQHNSMHMYVFGEKMAAILTRHKFPISKVHSYPKVAELDRKTINMYLKEIGGGDHSPPILVFHNDYRKPSSFEPQHFLLNPDLSNIEKYRLPEENELIVDSAANEIKQVLQSISIQGAFTNAMLSSLAAENAARFMILENAITNTDKLIQEFTLRVQSERQKRVTNEMRELAVSAGLVG